MELQELTELLADPKKLVDKITELAPEIPEEALKFQPEEHKVVTDLQYRPDRKVDVPTGTMNDKNEPEYRPETKPVHRIPSATQKLIIDWSVDLALSGGVEIDCSPREGITTDEVMLAMVKKTLEDNKFDYLAMEIERLKQRFGAVLLVWYSVEAEEGYWADITPNKGAKFKMRCTILSPEDGDIIIPIRDQFKDMIGAARKYKVKAGDKEIEKMDLFLKEAYMTFTQGEGSGWVLEKSTKTQYGKANFILDEQKRPEWADVSAKIERVEQIDSDTADENQQSAFPILVATGQIIAANGGGASNTRKTFQMEGDKADLRYVEAEGGQESASNERKNLRNDIFIETATPDLKFEDISGDLPGVTIEMMLLPSTNKAKRKQKGSIGIFHQRNLNFLKSAMAVINNQVEPSLGLVMKPKFKIELPRNLTEEYGNIVSLVGAGLMSKETAIAKLAFSADPAAEYEKIKAEAEEAQAKAMELAAKTKPVAPINE
ncbi:phage portal protein [Pedobacter nyackensis]|uniref:Phage portal protein, SPP1 family n=1 Tax=Pedobacter nyackensis TaxID=475255 RepID=A0A1W1ZWM5_9SPHI|nr:phage portal protein [Pedobacter nyackensis]SMC52820.1 phage portal protein, SPP1 family [Pedobacter nyackensis]